jgi:hypothetical protein
MKLHFYETPYEQSCFIASVSDFTTELHLALCQPFTGPPECSQWAAHKGHVLHGNTHSDFTTSFSIPVNL